MSDLRFNGGQVGARQLGDFRRPNDTPIRTYTEGRHCTCGTRISIYNPFNTCALCTPRQENAA